EDRTAPAVLTVNTLLDDSTPDNFLSLREAIGAVNSGSAAGLSAAEQVQISGAFGSNDTIQFSVTGTIQLVPGALPVNTDLKILGPGSNLLTIKGLTGSGANLFTLTSGTVTLSGLTL